MRAVAVRWCEPCPVIAECGEAAKWLRTDFGVWGGKDRTKRPRKVLHSMDIPVEADQ
jgi:hypothetical protein